MDILWLREYIHELEAEVLSLRQQADLHEDDECSCRDEIVIKGAPVKGASPCTFDDYQAAAKKTAIYPRNVRIVYPALGLAGEAGEVANKVKKIVRDDNGWVTDSRRDEIAKELGDVLWYVAALCSELNVSMTTVAAENLERLASRQVRGTITGSGDNR
jgi:NTP pyrophosphatase (non-canonical NTP hydrolase)